MLVGKEQSGGTPCAMAQVSEEKNGSIYVLANGDLTKVVGFEEEQSFGGIQQTTDLLMVYSQRCVLLMVPIQFSQTQNTLPNVTAQPSSNQSASTIMSV